MPVDEPEKKCDCGPECDCGCNEGKECNCGHHHDGPHCKCGCHGGECHCGCGKRCAGKLIALLIVFLAGMGFNELIHGCFGRCPSKAPCPKHVAMQAPAPAAHAPLPAYHDGAGTVIIINAGDGHADVLSGKKHFDRKARAEMGKECDCGSECGCDCQEGKECHCNHHHNSKKKHQKDRAEMRKNQAVGKISSVRPRLPQPKVKAENPDD